MSKPSRLARPLSTNPASRLPLSRKEDFSGRMRKISLGEKILRAGSEGNLIKKKQQQQHEQQVPAMDALFRQRVPGLKGKVWISFLDKESARLDVAK